MVNNSTAPRCNRVTLKDAKAQLKALGMTISRRVGGEYRVTFVAMSPEAAENIASYSNDLDDAVATAHDMHKRRQAQLRGMPV